MRRLLVPVAGALDAHGDCTRTSTSPLAAMDRTAKRQWNWLRYPSDPARLCARARCKWPCAGAGSQACAAQVNRTEERWEGGEDEGANDLWKAAGGVCAGRDM